MRVCPSDLVVSRLLREESGPSSGMPEVQDPGRSPRMRLLATLHAEKSTDLPPSDLCAAGGPSNQSDGDNWSGEDEEEDERCSRCKAQVEETQGSGVRSCHSPSDTTDRMCTLCRKRACFSPRSQSFTPDVRLRKRPFWRQLTSASLHEPVAEDSDGARLRKKTASEEDPNFLLVRKSQRFRERRNALCEPERMLISQEVRERLERDVERRRRSFVRRFSMFFTIRLDIHTEEDLF